MYAKRPLSADFRNIFSFESAHILLQISKSLPKVRTKLLFIFPFGAKFGKTCGLKVRNSGTFLALGAKFGNFLRSYVRTSGTF